MENFDNIRSYRESAIYYDLFANNDDLPFFLEIANRFGSPILELACGTGRVSIQLAEAGHKVTGIETTKEMLEIARKKQKDLPVSTRLKINFHHNDITKFNLQKKFPLIIIPSSFWFLIERDDQIACLQKVKEHLKDDGVFVLDLFPGVYKDREGAWSDKPSQIGDKIVKRFGIFKTDIDRKIQHNDIIIEVESKDGYQKRIETKSAVAIITNEDADSLIEETEFKIEEQYGGWSFEEFSEDSKRRIMLLRK